MKYTILDYLESTASSHPEKTAFADVQHSINWKDFVSKSKMLSTVVSQYFKSGQAVPVMIDKSVRTLEYFFAALYSGCFYSYFDATFPDSRLNSMIETLDVKYIICDRRFEKKVSGLNVTPLFFDDLEKEFNNNTEKYSDIRRKNIIDTDPVYANFTSGSTGTPKAVVVSHRSVIDFITCFTEIFEITEKDNIANQAPFDFDVSVKDIFSGIFTGATVHLVPKMFFSFPTKLLDYLEEREITTIIWAVSAMCILSTLNGFDYKVPSKLNKIMFSGEVMPCKQLEIWKKFIPNAQYINLYGPTEITCNCTYYKIPFDKIPEPLPIGIPFPNERIYLIDENNELVRFIYSDSFKSSEIDGIVSNIIRNEERLKKMFMQVNGKKIIEEAARKARKKTTILALIGALGIVGTGGYTLGENEKSGISGIKEKNGEIQIDMNEVEKDINIKNIMNQSERNEHQVFVKELQEQSLNENLEYIEALKKEVTQEIENLKTKEEVLSYTKQMYVDRYNGIHEEPIGVGNVTIRKNSYNKIFYEDHAKNGDIILRQCTESEAQEMGVPIDGVLSEISVVIKKDGELISESVAYHDGKFVTLYEKDEEVQANRDTILCELGNVVLQGIDRATSMDNEDTSAGIKDLYKGRFIQAVVDYKKYRNEEIKEKVESEQQTQKGFEMTED